MRWEIPPVVSLHANNQRLTGAQCSFPAVSLSVVCLFLHHLFNEPIVMWQHAKCLNAERILYFKDFILRKKGKQLSVPPGSYNTAVIIVCRAVSFKRSIDYVCLTDAL